MPNYKVCFIGASAVGKTAIFRRILTGTFDPNYVTTIGVVTDEYFHRDGEMEVHLDLYDTEGEDHLQKLRLEQLEGSHGYFLVIDGTRNETLEVASQLLEKAKQLLGDPVPFVCLMNKCDLRNNWEIDETTVGNLKKEGWIIFQTSAQSGEGLTIAIKTLVRNIIDNMANAKKINPVEAAAEQMFRELKS